MFKIKNIKKLKTDNIIETTPFFDAFVFIHLLK